jgi:AbrB family looped-hinge helix DNA binding protein
LLIPPRINSTTRGPLRALPLIALFYDSDAFCKVKQKFQVTIPTEIRDAVRLAVGDILEATVQGTSIVLTPKSVIDRQEVWEKIERAMASVKARDGRRKQSQRKRKSGLHGR